jgi:hypothetical protein
MVIIVQFVPPEILKLHFIPESPEVVDSDDFQSFDFSTNKWSTLTKLTAPTSHSATLGNGHLQVVTLRSNNPL